MTATIDSTETIIDNGGRVDIPAGALDEATKRIDSANRRLDRAGITDRFTYDLEHYDDITRKDGVTVVEPRIVLTLNAPTLSFGGWQFQASLDIIDGQAIVSTIPGADLSDWQRPSAHHCDHCGLSRSRTRSYVVRHEDTGELRQVGRSCLPLFLGLRPAGLWALQWGADDLSDLTERDEFGGPARPVSYDARQLLALATVISERGRNFVSRAMSSMDGSLSTSDVVWQVLEPSPKETIEETTYRLGALDAAAAVDDTDLDDMIASVDGLGDTDYAQNLRVLAGQEHIPGKQVALWVSLVGVYFKHERRKAILDALPDLTGDYLAEEGDKLADITGTITVLTSFESNYGYQTKTLTVLVVHTDCGHLLKWMGAVPSTVDGHPLEARQRITIARATVKGHEDYKGTPHTRIVRAKLARPAAK